MSSETTYNCDSCGKTIGYQEQNQVEINRFFHAKDYDSFELCDRCLDYILVKMKLKKYGETR